MCVANGYDTLYLSSNLLNPTSPQPSPGQIGDDTGYSCTPGSSNHPLGGGGGGGGPRQIFWSSRFELLAPQVPLIIRETFGEIPGPRRPTVSEPRPAQKLGVKYSFTPDYPRGANGAPNCSSHHLDSSHIGFDGSRTNSLAVAAQNAIAEIRRGCLN